MHLGLSPYCRGSGTNFWPLVFEQPECVGATIHLAVLSVDAGAILVQVRPDAEIGDRAHELGTKTIMAGAAALPRVLELFAAGQIAPRTQDLSRGRVFRRKDFNAAAVRQMWQNFETGMMRDYLTNAVERRAQFPIVEVPQGEYSHE
jgi:methionyl-tRNA formyltransferase